MFSCPDKDRTNLCSNLFSAEVFNEFFFPQPGTRKPTDIVQSCEKGSFHWSLHNLVRAFEHLCQQFHQIPRKHVELLTSLQTHPKVRLCNAQQLHLRLHRPQSGWLHKDVRDC